MSPTEITPPQAITLRAADGQDLAASLFEPMSGNGIAVQINGATGVPRRYYEAFAQYLASRGFTVLTYDFRGIGDSRPSAGAKPPTMLRWGMLDMAAAAEWIARNRPQHRHAVVGHSFGGQILGLSEHAARYDAAFFVAAQSGYWRYWPWRQRIRLLLAWYLFVPVLTALFGELPGWFLGGAALPKGVALEWARWCRTPHYLSGEDGRPLRPFYDRMRGPILNLSFSDDPSGPRDGVAAMLGYYPMATKEHRHRRPEELGVKAVGHFGFFRRAMPIAEWQAAAEWIEQAVIARTERAA